MSAMTRVALPSKTWTTVHAAGGTDVALNLHSNVEIFLFVGPALPTDLTGPFVVMQHPAKPFSLSSGDVVHLYNNSTVDTSVTVWA